MRDKTVKPDEIGHFIHTAIVGVWHEGMRNGQTPRMPFDEDVTEDEKFSNIIFPIWNNKRK